MPGFVGNFTYRWELMHGVFGNKLVVQQALAVPACPFCLFIALCATQLMLGTAPCPVCRDVPSSDAWSSLQSANTSVPHEYLLLALKGH
jgi:hypothetical protein